MSDSGNSGTISELSWHWSKKLSHVFCRRWQKVVRFTFCVGTSEMHVSSGLGFGRT